MDRYWLSVGTSQGLTDIYDAPQDSALSRTVTDLPITGDRIWVRLNSHFMSTDTWSFRDAWYGAPIVYNATAALTGPACGTALTDPATFTWTSAFNTKFFLTIGNAPGASDIYSAPQRYNRAVTVPGLPAGRPIFVRLYWYVVYPEYPEGYLGSAVADARWDFMDCAYLGGSPPP